MFALCAGSASDGRLEPLQLFLAAVQLFNTQRQVKCVTETWVQIQTARQSKLFNNAGVMKKVVTRRGFQSLYSGNVVI